MLPLDSSFILSPSPYFLLMTNFYEASVVSAECWVRILIDPPSLRSEHSPAAACGFVSHGLGQVVLYLLIVHVTKR